MDPKSRTESGVAPRSSSRCAHGRSRATGGPDLRPNLGSAEPGSSSLPASPERRRATVSLKTLWLEVAGLILLAGLASAESAPLVHLTIGDSIEEARSIEDPYVRLDGWTTYNLAYRGTMSIDWVTEGQAGCQPNICGAAHRITGFEALEIEPDLITIKLGTNDSRGNGTHSAIIPALYQWYLAILIVRLQDTWPDAIVLLNKPPGALGLDRWADLRLSKYRRVIDDLGEMFGLEEGVDFLTVLPLVTLRDDVHPMQGGHDIMNDALEAHVGELARKLCRRHFVRMWEEARSVRNTGHRWRGRSDFNRCRFQRWIASVEERSSSPANGSRSLGLVDRR
jgi:hypothetical protein